MTKKHMMLLASMRLYDHFLILYFPEELAEGNPENPTVPTQKLAHSALSRYMRKTRQMGLRLCVFLKACSVRETRFLRLSSPLLPIEQEVDELFKDAETLFEGNSVKYDG